MIFKYVYKVAGEHVHVKAYAGNTPADLAQAGTLCYNVREWNVFMGGHINTPGYVFEQQVISGLATRGNNDYRQDLA